MVVRSERMLQPPGVVGCGGVRCPVVRLPLSVALVLYLVSGVLARKISPKKYTPKSCIPSFWCGIIFI